MNQPRKMHTGEPGNPGQFARAELRESRVRLEDGTEMWLRDEDGPEDEADVLHMGPGLDIRAIAANVRDNYRSYEWLNDGQGLFCLSVFAEANGVTARDIFAALPRYKMLASTTYSQVVDSGHELLPTSSTFPDLSADEQQDPARVAAHAEQKAAYEHAQAAHYDIVLPVDVGPDLAGKSLGEMTKNEKKQVVTAIAAYLDEQIMPLLGARKSIEEYLGAEEKEES